MKYLLPLLPLLLALSSCSVWQQQGATDDDESRSLPPAPQYLGTVHQVYPAQKFALLRIIGPIPTPGTTLISHPADGSTVRMGNLVVAEDAAPRSNILAADIRSGTVASGDRVFLYRNISPPDVDEKKPAEQSNLQQSEVAPAPLSVHTAGTANTPQPAVPAAPALPPEPEKTEAVTPRPALPLPPDVPTQAPSYLQDIPSDISQWD